MAKPLLKNKVLREIELVPEEWLTDLYRFIHYYRLGLEKSQSKQSKPTMAFAGCWQNIPDDVFDDFIDEMTRRRQ